MTQDVSFRYDEKTFNISKNRRSILLRYWIPNSKNPPTPQPYRFRFALLYYFISNLPYILEYIHPTDKERLELTIHALWGSKSGGSTTPFSLSLFLFSFRKMCWGKEKKENARIFIQTNKAATRRNWRTPHTLNLQVKKE